MAYTKTVEYHRRHVVNGRLDTGVSNEQSRSPRSRPQEMKQRRMRGRKNVAAFLFIYLCFVSVCPARSCGKDPLGKLYHFSQATGQTLESVLADVLRQDPQRYQYLIQGHQLYDDCVIRVETGSFKRSSAGIFTNLFKTELLRPSSQLLKRRQFYFSPGTKRQYPNIPLDREVPIPHW